ncbi:MAG TPA: hypothetical protein VK324_02940 [Tepidisphaeraceae bacterium]|nr:hypothetical protein [Tepidisphaeraceae bacterium]
MPDPTDEQIAEAFQALDQAAEMAAAAGADVSQFRDYLDAGMPEHAHEALRQATNEVAMPFGFFVLLSKAAELLGLRP